MKTSTIALTALVTSLATATLILSIIAFGRENADLLSPDSADAAGTTQVLTLAGADFQPGGDGAGYSNFFGSLLSNNSSWYVAPVQLPQGAQVTKLTAYGWDNGGNTYYVNLYRHNLSLLSSVSMADVTSYNSAANPNKIMDTTIAAPLIDNSQAAYYVKVNLSGVDALNLRGLKIVYLY